VINIDTASDQLSTIEEESKFPEEDYEIFLQDPESSSSATKTSESRFEYHMKETTLQDPMLRSFGVFADLTKITTAGGNDDAANLRQSSLFNPNVSEFTPHLTAQSLATNDEETFCTFFEVFAANTPTVVETEPMQGGWRTLPVLVGSSSTSMWGLNQTRLHLLLSRTAVLQCKARQNRDLKKLRLRKSSHRNFSAV
jgi:hypothetical protein